MEQKFEQATENAVDYTIEKSDKNHITLTTMNKSREYQVILTIYDRSTLDDFQSIQADIYNNTRGFKNQIIDSIKKIFQPAF